LAGIKLFRGPELRRLDGSAAMAGKAELAALLLVFAAVLSAVAAFLALPVGSHRERRLAPPE
jgi:hypothetical protein